MKCRGVWIFVALFFCSIWICPKAAALASELFTYEELIELGKEEFSKGRYELSIEYFQRAGTLEPTEKNPIYFIQLIKRIRDGRVAFLELDENSQLRELPPQLKEKDKPPPKRQDIILTKAKKSKQKLKTIIDFIIEERQRRRVAVVEILDPPIMAVYQKPPVAQMVTVPVTANVLKAKPKEKTVQRVVEPRKSYSTSTIDTLDDRYVLRLDDEMWNRQPNTRLEIELDKALVLQGNNIERFLVIFEGFYEGKKLDKDRTVLTPIKRGRSLLHLWDDRGRWTFNVEVVTPILIETSKLKEIDLLQQPEESFKFKYSNDWNTFYTGDSFNNLKRQNLNFRQWMEIYGQTPYGHFDSHVIFTKFDASTEVTGYGVGLTNAKIGNFKDFSIRGFDTSKQFSELSMPGKYFRGVLVDAKAFDRNIEWTYLRGLERTTFGFVSPGVVDKVDSYIEGAQVTLFPERENNYSLNFVRGFGDARNPSLKDQVSSVEVNRNIKGVKLRGELAYDEDAYAGAIHSKYKRGSMTFDVNFRDIDEDFVTISGVPAGSGEIGGLVNLNWLSPRLEWNMNVDVYQERDDLEKGDSNELNYDVTASVNVPLAKRTKFRTDVFFIDTPGLASERRDLRVNSNLSTSFQISDYKRLSTFVGASYQRSRFDNSPANEYDRYKISAGLRLPVIRNLSYFANYDYSIVKEEADGNRSYPSVLSTGMSYVKQFTKTMSTDVSFTYRNEENTEDNFSFLAGEDSITGGVGFRYTPREDFEFFMDGRVRNVWAEQLDGPAFNEVDIRAGVRTTWDTLFRWNPTGYVHGFVFKDNNGNNRFDEGEFGLENIVVRVGKHEVTTDETGRYTSEIKAKKARVSLAIDQLPEGFIPSGVLQKDVRIVHQEVVDVNFGLNVRSGIYGVVYFDTNDNNRLDQEDEFISRVRIVLDGDQEITTDYEGVYFFADIESGRHTIQLDVNSLPPEYLPKIKIKNEIDLVEGATYVFHIPLKK